MFTTSGNVNIQRSATPGDKIPNSVLIHHVGEGPITTVGSLTSGNVNIHCTGFCEIRGGNFSDVRAASVTRTVTIRSGSLLIDHVDAGVGNDNHSGRGYPITASPTIHTIGVIDILTPVGGDCTLIGGDLIGARPSHIFTEGSLNMNIGGDILATAGVFVGSLARIAGSLTDIDAGGNITLTGTTNALAEINTSGSTNVFAAGNVTLNPDSQIVSDFDLTVIADFNMSLLDNAHISSPILVNLVEDNENPVRPLVGAEAFVKEINATITSSSPVRIFTAIRTQNTKERIFVRAGDTLLNRGNMRAIQAELKSGGNPYGYAIRHDGLIEATGVEYREGRVLLVAELGETAVYGEIFAQNGGTVHILGNRVGLFDEALIDASGEFCGGTVLIGGDFQGQNPEIMTAEFACIAPPTHSLR